jgi:hypothetical protein
MATKTLNDDTPSFKQQKKALKQSNKLAALAARGERIKAGTEPTLYEKTANITGNIAKTAGSAAEVVSAIKNRNTGTSGNDPFKEQKGGGIKRSIRKAVRFVKKNTIGSLPKNRMKTGGMVNSNSKITASKVAKGRPIKSTAPKKALPKAQKGWSVDDPYKRGVMGAGASATKTSPRRTGGLSVIHGGTRTKTINAGGIYPGAKGSITKSKTDNKGKVTGSRTREISQEKANRMINRKRS